jgi:hypothetical protein
MTRSLDYLILSIAAATIAWTLGHQVSLAIVPILDHINLVLGNVTR